MKHILNVTNIDHGTYIKFKNMLKKHNIKFNTKVVKDKHGMPKIINYKGNMIMMIETIHFEKYDDNVIAFKLEYL